MKTRSQRIAAFCGVAFILFIAVLALDSNTPFSPAAQAQVSPSPTPGVPPIAEPQFDQSAALAKLREQIKGREQEPAPKVFTNIRTNMIKSMPAARVLAVMEFGYSRSLGVSCTHCHVADKWDSDANPKKQVARDMAAMMTKINDDLLKAVPNLSKNPTVNCTTCHRGQIKPATNLQPRS